MESSRKKQTVVSGIRATGKLHLGNYLGAMRNFVVLQEQYDCYFFIADYHSLTTEDDAGNLKAHLVPIVIDYLAIGLDPEKCVLFAQSSVPEIAELTLLLSMVQPKADLESLPTWREKKEDQEAKGKIATLGLFNYPMLMAADILIQKAALVPVGKDQLPHIYFARDVARRFNARYGETFPSPDILEGKAIRVPGLDGADKMGKSSGNTIDLIESAGDIRKKLAVAVTDTNRKRRQDIGNPFECNIFALHELISDPALVSQMQAGCQSAGIGCVDCKRALGNEIIKLLGPFQQRRAEIKPDYAEEVLREGGKRARESAQRTVREVREKMGLPNLDDRR